jgi:hypothetical protein
MANRQGKRPDVDELLRRIPQDGGDLFRGASAWAEDLPGWTRSVREVLQEAPARTLRRTVWDDPRSNEARIVIDVVECASAPEAMKGLLDRLEWNQLAELPEGPPGLGIASFAHPEGAPPAVFFVRANLCVSVASFARRAAAVLPAATVLDRRFGAQPVVGGPPLGLDAERGTRGEVVRLRPALPFRLGEEGHLRYRVRGGTLEVRDDEVVVIPAPGAEVRVELFAEESGRMAAVGTLVLPR